MFEMVFGDINMSGDGQDILLAPDQVRRLADSLREASTLGISVEQITASMALLTSRRRYARRRSVRAAVRRAVARGRK